MKTGRHAVVLLRGITLVVALSLAPTATLWADPPPAPSTAAAQSDYGHLPLSFAANQGHTDCTHSVTRISLISLNHHGDGQ